MIVSKTNDPSLPGVIAVNALEHRGRSLRNMVPDFCSRRRGIAAQLNRLMSVDGTTSD